MSTAHLDVQGPDFAGGRIPDEFTCDGANAVPTLTWSPVPAGTKSLALIVDDPDAPRRDFVHWIVWNIDPNVGKLDGSNADQFVNGRNGFGNVGWGGPCPPHGDEAHRYVFHLYALDRLLDLQRGADRAALEQALEGHVLARGELVARY